VNILKFRKPAEAPAPDFVSEAAISPYFELPEASEAAPARDNRGPAIKFVAGIFAVLGVIVVALVWIQHLFAAPATQSASMAPAAATIDAAADTHEAVGPSEAFIRPASSDAPAQPPVDAVAQLEASRADAEEMLKARLPDPVGAQFRNVKTSLSSDNGQTLVDFCGEVNIVNPTGAYVGFQRFVSSRRGATIEQSAAPGDFAQAWSRRCTGSAGPSIWR
jgi:hypothetical protein